jgi:hypothetical protein
LAVGHFESWWPKTQVAGFDLKGFAARLSAATAYLVAEKIAAENPPGLPAAA